MAARPAARHHACPSTACRPHRRQSGARYAAPGIVVVLHISGDAKPARKRVVSGGVHTRDEDRGADGVGADVRGGHRENRGAPGIRNVAAKGAARRADRFNGQPGRSQYAAINTRGCRCGGAAATASSRGARHDAPIATRVSGVGHRANKRGAGGAEAQQQGGQEHGRAGRHGACEQRQPASAVDVAQFAPAARTHASTTTTAAASPLWTGTSAAKLAEEELPADRCAVRPGVPLDFHPCTPRPAP